VLEALDDQSRNMDQLFKSYEKSFKALCETEEDEIPRQLRLFNIRLRLALDMNVDFSGEFSLTRTKIVRETYSLIFRLLETWNAYEALSHYAKEVGSYVGSGNAKSRIYSKEFLEKTGALASLQETLVWLRNEYLEKSRMKDSLDCYLGRIEKDVALGKTIKDDARAISDYLRGLKNISGVEFFSLIYAERNLYYHNGESAKMGMNYSDRKLLISRYREVLVESLIKISVLIMDEQNTKSM
jgi:hypothetical protein